MLIFSAFKIDAQQNSIKNISVEDGLPSNIIYDIKQDQIGYLWIATDKGLVKFDGDDFTQINKFKTTNLFIDRNNIIYTGLENGLFIKNKSKEHYINSKKINKIFSFEKNIFVGTSEGIYFLKDNKLEPLKINSTLDFSIINDILFCDDSFYIASNNGLLQIDSLQKPKSIRKIIEENIISLESFDDKVIATTSKNNLLVVKNNSIVKTIETLQNISSVKKLKNEIWVTSKTSGLEIFVLPSFSFKQKINKYNSLQTNTINSVFRDIQNSTFIASENGIYILRNNIFQKKSIVKPVIHFENLQINHKNIDSLFVVKNSKLSSIENNISITFKTVDILNPKKIKYRYKLVNSFSPWSSNNTVQFPNINAGKYTFQVQSKIENVESDIKSFSFTIDTPFYKKAWFLFTIIISLLLIGYISIHFYILNINKVNKEKIDKLKLRNRLLSLEQKALQLQMNPHFIFNVLNGIKALGNSGKTNELNHTVSKFSVLLRGILNNSRKEEITLQEEIELLKNYIELEQRMSSKSFTYNIVTNLNNIDAEEILVPTMLIQPFVENCIQHAFQKNTTGTIHIQFNVKHRFLNCTIIDNGIGIHQSKNLKKNTNHKSVALNVAKDRLHIISINSSFKIEEIIEDNKVKGTKVYFKIPLKTDY